MPKTPSDISLSLRKKSSILGALVADAATLGLHWIYDPKRVRDVGGNTPEFLDPDEENYEGVSSYFAHPNKKSGDNTHYGDQCNTLLESLANTSGKWSPADYQNRIRSTYGSLGNYDGYLDTATKETVARIESNETQTDENFTPLGSQDTQAPAFSKLPALVAKFAGDPTLLQKAETAIRITNDSDEAVAYGLFAARSLESVILGNDLKTALSEAAAASTHEVKEKITEAIAFENTDPAAISEKFGMPCNLFQTLPVSTCILLSSNSFAKGVRNNILAAGDNAGRAIFIGAMLGAAFADDSENGVPSEWIDRLTRKDKFIEDIDTVIQ